MAPLQLSSQLAATFERMLDTGHFASADDVLQQALELLEERERFERLRASLIAAEAATKRGKLIDWTPELRRQIRQEANELARQGALPDPDVCP